MGKFIKRTISIIMVVLMVLTSAPLSGFVGINLRTIKANASEDTAIEMMKEVDLADSFTASGSSIGAVSFFGALDFNGCYGNQLSAVAKELYDSMVEYYATNKNIGEYTYTFETPFTFNAEVSGGSIVMNDELEEIAIQLQYAMQSAMDAFLYDHPEVFWLRIISFSYGISATGIIDDITIKPTEIYSGASSKISQYNTAVNTTLNEITVTESRYDTLKNIHDYICSNAYYNLIADYCVHSSEAFFIGDGGVVCEGYAKTFKVICDELNIPCVLVSGDAGGAHMWNYVQMEDGKWYLVDVTWDDQESGLYDTYFLANANTVGFNDVPINEERTERNDFSGTGIFSFTYPVLSSSAYVVHTHSWESVYTIDAQPTCTEKGSKSIHCKTCDATKSVTEIPATNHANRYILDAIAATCTTAGYTEGVYCVDCQMLLEGRTEIPATHTDNNSDDFCDICEIYLSSLYETGSCGNGITYEWYDNGTVYITGEGKMTDYSSGGSPFYNSDIKKVVLRQGVTSVGDFSFQNCKQLESVSVPDSLISFGKYSFSYAEELDSISIHNGVTTIGICAFYNCKSITSLSLPDSIMSIGSDAFYGTAYYNDASNWQGDVFYINKHLIEAKNEITGSYTIKAGTLTIAGRAFHLSKKLTAISIPNSVKSIGWMAFYSCNGLKNITIPNSVTQIEYEAFDSCENLETVTLSNNINLIDEGTFAYCKSLKTIIIPDSVTTIGKGAFRDCTSLASVQFSKNLTEIKNFAFYNSGIVSVNLPESVTSIATDVFNSSKSLSVVNIPSGVSFIGDGAFGACTALTEINVDDDNLFYSSQDGVLFNKNKTELLQYTLGNSRTSYIVPNGVTVIDSYSFTPCYKLKSIVIPTSLTSIGRYAFEYCSFISNVYYRGTQAQWQNIQISIGNNRLTGAMLEYSYCPHTDKVSYEKQDPTCTKDGQAAGEYCPDCAVWLVGGEVIPATGHTDPDLGYICDVCGDFLQTVQREGKIGNAVYYYLFSDGTLTIKGFGETDDYTEISSPFWCDQNIKRVVVKNGVSSIGSNVFKDCINLESILMADSVTAISYGVFASCSKLFDITLSSKLTQIGHRAFYECVAIKDINLPETLKIIASQAFGKCTSLEGITIPDSVTTLEGDVFYDCKNLKQATLPANLKEIPMGLFSGCERLENVNVPEGVVIIKDWAFNDCKKLTELVLPDGLKKIEQGAFNGCSSLAEIAIPEGVIYIGDNAFNNCSSIKEITIPEGVTSIANNAFYYCSSLEEITIPKDVTSIGDHAFAYCDKFTQIIIPENVSSIGNDAFRSCSNLKEITIPESVTSIGDSAFIYCHKLNEVFYAGTEQQWSAIAIGTDNTRLTNSSVYYCHYCPHSISEWTADQNGNHIKTCNNAYPCPYTETENCSFEQWDVIKEPTCEETGSKTSTCLVCAYVATVEIEALGHTHLPAVEENRTEADCENDGSYDNVVYCSVCGDEISRKTVVIPALGHKPSTAVEENRIEAVCDKEGSYDKVVYCSVCGDEINRETVVLKSDHAWKDMGLDPAPTCSQQGRVKYVCENDPTHVLYKDVEINSKNHAGGTYLLGEIQATCISKGYTGDTYCGGCNKLLSNGKTIYPNNNHVKTVDVKAVAPDCETDGYTAGVYCDDCKKYISGHEVIKATKHAKQKYYPLQNATCTETGLSQGIYCPDCNIWLLERDIIPAKGHSYKTTIQSATVNSNGSIEMVCAFCSDSQSSIIYYPKTIKLSSSKVTYNGKVRSPSVIVKDSNGNTLIFGTDYDVSIPSGTKTPGQYTYTIKFKGNYEGEKKLTFTILPKVPTTISATQSTSVIKLTWSESVGATGYRVYQYSPSKGKYVQIASVKGVTSYRKTTNLKAGTEYKFKVKPYTKLSDGTVLWGTASEAFATATECKAPSIKSVTSPSKSKATVKWSNVDGETGYQLYYSTKKDSGYKKINSYSANTLTGSKTFSASASGKTIYFKVRAYKKVNGQTIFSEWSAVKSVKVK